MRTYRYALSNDGTDEAYDVLNPHGEILATIPFWDDREKAEMKARLIVNALDAYRPTIFERVKAIVTEHDNAMNLNAIPLEL